MYLGSSSAISRAVALATLHCRHRHTHHFRHQFPHRLEHRHIARRNRPHDRRQRKQQRIVPRGDDQRHAERLWLQLLAAWERHQMRSNGRGLAPVVHVADGLLLRNTWARELRHARTSISASGSRLS